MNRIRELLKEGQSVWLDYIRRDLVQSGELTRLVQEDGIRGVTSNPTIFEKAIAGSTDYDGALGALLAENPKAPVEKLYETLAIEDIQMAADVLRPVYEETEGADGYVSLEVSPHLAHDTPRTIAEAKRLKAAVARPNLMIKVPATLAGIPAIEALIADGVNVNVTLMFSMSHYEAVARAYIKGLERCAAPARVASVASFFVSRVDTMVDRALESLGTAQALALLGKVAVANSKIVYDRFLQIFHGEGFAPWRQRGARVQRPLWASTGTKNPKYSDVLYVENLIGEETVNTLPPETLKAFKDHGRIIEGAVRDNLDEAAAVLGRLSALGIDLNAITEKLQQDGVGAFAASFDQLMTVLEKKRKVMTEGMVNRQEFKLSRYERRFKRLIRDLEIHQFTHRLWHKDPGLWSSEPQAELTDRLGWLELPGAMEKRVSELKTFADGVRAEGFRHVALLGMGGSSLAPEVFQQTFGSAPGYPTLTVLDSTHPRAVQGVLSRINLEQTLFLVSSKSGTTTETQSLFYFFWNQLKQLKNDPGQHFVAITDPGTPLEQLAIERNFRAIFKAPEDVGGRYSALSVFGLVPAALIGVDVETILEGAQRMSRATGPSVAESQNPALLLGAALGDLALLKRNKVTFFTSPSLAAFPSWAEQLIAESTGKNRRGVVPVADEKITAPLNYGADRFFVFLRLRGDDPQALDQHMKGVEAEGHPLASIELNEKSDIGQEFFRWEMAVATAGAVLGIHPFNQPDVQLAKDLAKEAMSKRPQGRKRWMTPREEISIADPGALTQALAAWMRRKKEGDYVAIQAYISPTREHNAALKEIREILQERLQIATTLGYGPRFLHSTGQLHKGGPNSVLVLQIIDQCADNLEVPETNYTFDALIHAQAVGDFTALKQRRRRVLRVNLGSDTEGGLVRLAEMLRH
jgi:transaldolase/glucose-6-phosphate isomerase